MEEIKTVYGRNDNKIEKVLKIMENNQKNSINKVVEKLDDMQTNIKNSITENSKLMKTYLSGQSNDSTKMLEQAVLQKKEIQSLIDLNKDLVDNIGNGLIIKMEDTEEQYKIINSKIDDFDEKIKLLQKEMEKLKSEFKKSFRPILDISKVVKPTNLSTNMTTTQLNKESQSSNMGNNASSESNENLTLLLRQSQNINKSVYLGNIDSSMTKEDVEKYLLTKFKL